MNIVQCKSFLKLVETKNFTKASQELFQAGTEPEHPQSGG